MLTAMLFATVAAFLTITTLGAAESIPHLETVKDVLARIPDF
jgi:sugar/nucleoside kinase (ribokinase family)